MGAAVNHVAELMFMLQNVKRDWFLNAEKMKYIELEKKLHGEGFHNMYSSCDMLFSLNKGAPEEPTSVTP